MSRFQVDMHGYWFGTWPIDADDEEQARLIAGDQWEELVHEVLPEFRLGAVEDIREEGVEA